MAEESAALRGVVMTAGGAILARYPIQTKDAATPAAIPPAATPPVAIIEPDRLKRILDGESWSEGSRLFAPVTIGASTVAAMMIERPAGSPFPAEQPRRLLAHASHTGLAWSPLPEDIDPESDPLPPLHVLVAEDNEVNRKVAKAFLEHAGHAVAVCGDGRQAVEAVRDGDFDVVLMDIRMPGMDGVEATRIIRALPDRRRAGLPILALTANFTTAEVEEYMAAGMNDVIRKPLRLGDIERALAPYFDLPETPPSLPDAGKESPEALPEQPKAEAPILDQERVALLAEALPPARLMELFESARASIVETLAELRQSWETADIPTAGKAAHRLAGVAANFGCTALGELARAIEMECKLDHSGQQYADALQELERLTLEALSDRV